MINGLYGDRCTCGLTVNYVSPAAGYKCHCGRYNSLPYSGGMIPHLEPDLGLTGEEFWAQVPQWYRTAILRLTNKHAAPEGDGYPRVPNDIQ